MWRRLRSHASTTFSHERSVRLQWLALSPLCVSCLRCSSRQLQAASSSSHGLSRRHQSTRSSSSSPTSPAAPAAPALPSSVVSCLPYFASSRPLSSLAPRVAEDSSPASSPSEDSISSRLTTLDGSLLPSSPSALRALVERLRPSLYLALSRLSHPNALIPRSIPTPTPTSSSPFSLDWLSDVDVDGLALSTLESLHQQGGVHHSRDVIHTIVRAVEAHLTRSQYADRLVHRRDELSRRRRELRRAAQELERIKAEIAKKRAQLPGQREEAEQPTLARANGAKEETRTLSVPLHQHQLGIYDLTDQPSASPSPASHPAISTAPSRRLPPTFHLYNEQLQLESLALDEAVQSYAELTSTLVSLQRGSQLRPAQRMMLLWYTPLMSAIEKEQERARGVKEKKLTGLEQHLPYLLHLSAPQLAVLTMHTMFSLALAHVGRDGLAGVKFVTAADAIGHTVNMEVKMELMRKDRNRMRQFIASIVSAEGASGAGTAASSTSASQLTSPNVLSKLRASKKNQWSDEVCIKLGAALIQLLLHSAAVPDVPRVPFMPAFRHELVWDARAMRGGGHQKQGLIVTDERVLAVVLRDHDATEAMMPKLKPMIVPPRPWTASDDGGYLSVGTRVMRSHGSIMQMAAVAKSELPAIYRGLNFLSQVPWTINAKVLDVVGALWDAGGGVAALPSLTDVPVPAIPHDVSSSEKKALQREQSAAVRHNRNLHSLRCDVNLKLSVARQFRGRTIYFPFNVDFRGRAYPIPPHLNHIGNDLCRGVLLFEEKRRLGPAGLRWLRIHATNLWGHGKEKLPFDERLQWCQEHLDLIRQAAADPLAALPSSSSASAAPAWWLQAEKPFQFLAACLELAAAYAGRDPCDYECALPVHQDGSCNGLQHYAALGRDEEGGAAVNLTPSPRPQDVYSVVCARVLQTVKEDAVAGNASAALLDGKVTRKVVKQTVMTSVYGVTLIGAKEQIKARLSELTTVDWPQPREAAIATAALYLAKVTLHSLYSAFEGARRIQDWLSDCATRMAAVQQPVSWLTPLGLPVIQPYRRAASFAVHTIMQQVNLASHSDLLPVSGQRQKSAFPPNFIHSLDATHMLLTALRCEEEGLVFTAVHDSYWTHAADMDHMGRLLREEFVRLYRQPILERVREEWEMRFPQLSFPPVPKVGDLQLELVHDSPYFFN